MASYDWHQTTPGRYERDMDDVEIHYNLISNATMPLGRQMWATTATIKLDLQTEDFVVDVRRAWTALRKQHPSIACKVEGNKKVYEIVPDQPALDQWLADTVIVVDDPNSETLFPKLSSRVVKQSTIFLLPATKEIMVRITHEHADAEAMIRVLDCLAKNLSNTSDDIDLFTGGEVPHLSLALSSGIDLPVTTTEQGMALAGDALQNYASNLPGLGIPAKTMDHLPGDARHYDFSFGAEESARIVQASKARGLTPLHVLQTAAIMATYQLCEDKSRKFATFGIFGLRNRCSEPVKSDPLGINVIGWPTVHEPPYDSFGNLAQRVKSFYTGFPSDPRLLEGLRPHWQMMKPALLPGAPAPAPASDPMISSLGIVDPLLDSTYEGTRKVVIKDFWMATNVMTPNPAVHFWTWQSEMRIVISYNETYYAEVDIVKFLDLVLSILKAEGIST